MSSTGSNESVEVQRRILKACADSATAIAAANDISAAKVNKRLLQQNKDIVMKDRTIAEKEQLIKNLEAQILAEKVKQSQMSAVLSVTSNVSPQVLQPIVGDTSVSGNIVSPSPKYMSKAPAPLNLTDAPVARRGDYRIVVCCLVVTLVILVVIFAGLLVVHDMYPEDTFEQMPPTTPTPPEDQWSLVNRALFVMVGVASFIPGMILLT